MTDASPTLDDKKIDGKAFAGRLREKVAAEVARFQQDHNVTPGLAVVLVGEDPASQVYVRNKGVQTKEAGMNSLEYKLAADTSEADLLALVEKLNHDPAVHGILVQLPVPDHIDEKKILDAINPAKDVDGFHVENAGALATGQPGMVPCTPAACELLLQDRLGDMSGMEAVVIGRSNIVGKPMAQLLLRNNCTVTLAHSRTKDLGAVVRRADIVVAAVGRPNFVQGDWIKKGATVIDVGINRLPPNDEGKAKLVGDVDYAAAYDNAAGITPVPGGVGPMTIAGLLRNTVIAAAAIHGIETDI